MPRLAVERDETDTVELKLRIKEPLRAALAQSAGRRGISLNAEMSLRLEESFELRQEMAKREESQRQLIDQLSKELSAERRRASAQHDVLLQIIARHMKLVPKDQTEGEDSA
jgi:hypothetical protein